MSRLKAGLDREEGGLSSLPSVAPETYAEWCNCLSYLKDSRHDHEIKHILSQGRLSWTSGVAERFSERLALVFSERLEGCAQRLNRTISYSYDESGLLTALLAARRTLSFLYEIANLECFPELLRKHLSGELERYAKQTQSSLENSALSDRTGKLLSLMRHNSILNYANRRDLPAESAGKSERSAPAAASGPGQAGQKFKKRNFL